MTKPQAFELFRRVREEFYAAGFAANHILTQWNEDPRVIEKARQAQITDSELKRCKDNLEITYALRLFAEFEGVLRDYWNMGIKKKSRPDMQPLMESIARRRGMIDDDLYAADEIREFRNKIIHENLRSPRFDFPQCVRALGKYIAWLPQQW
jgi:hypothetical protein